MIHFPLTTEAYHPACFSSYAIAPFTPEQVTSLRLSLSYGEKVSILLPCGNALPSSLLADARFCEGASWGYENSYGEAFTSLEIVQRVAREFLDGVHLGDTPAFSAGFTVGALSLWSEQNMVMALVGLRHLCYLVSCFLSAPSDGEASFSFSHVGGLHDASVRTLHDRICSWQAQGYFFPDAQRLAMGLTINAEEVNAHD